MEGPVGRFVMCVGALALVLVGFQPAFAQVQGQWTSVGAMQSPREMGAQVRLAHGEVLAVGGVDSYASGNILASAELFDPATSAWTTTGSMAAARQQLAAVVLTNGKVLVTGGLGPGGAVVGSAELYNPATGSWSPAGSLSVARFAHSATLLKTGQVLVTGGCTVSACSAPTAVSELFDPTTNTWSTTGALNTARSYHNAVRLSDGRVLAIGGLASGATASSELYHPATGTWSVAASANYPRYLSTANLLPSGKVLVAGGASGRFPMNSAELYDPTANTWTPTGAMTFGTYAHSSMALPDGTVVLSGGYGQSISCGKDCTGFVPTARAEIYSEAAGTFAAISSLPRALAYHTTTLLRSGRALEAGGIGTTAYCCVVVPDASDYTPLTLTLSATSLNFGLLKLGLTSAPQTVTVSNVSGHPATFSSIAASGDYAETNTCPATLEAGQQCAIDVTFKPTGAGTRNGAVTLADDSPGSPTQTIALSGTGETLAFGFTPASVNFGGVLVGSSGSAIATLTNDGSAPVAISGISIAPTNHTYTQTNTCPPSLAVQQTCPITIVFTPPDVFTYKATLSVGNSAGAAATLKLSGTGLDQP
jgi:hypothetical protein